MRHVTRIARIALPAALVVAALVALAAAPATFAAGTGGMTAAAIEQDHAVVTLGAGVYRIDGAPDAQRIEMEGFGQLVTPGKPRLPMQRFLIALPPGARARDVTVLSTESTELPGTYRIEPSPAMLPVADAPWFDTQLEEMRGAWQTSHDATYATDDVFPARPAWLAGSGTLRKYSYASVAFCPFTYRPRSGRLVLHEQVQISIELDLPAPGSAEARHTVELLHDTVADERASRLFANLPDVRTLYEPTGPSSGRAGPYDYVIITTSGLLSAVQSSSLPAWRASLGHGVRVVLTTDVEIAGQPGGDLAERIRSFLRNYYATWGIEYVLLVGDYATVPMRICYPDPSFHVYDPSDPGLIAPGTPTDYYYADLSFPDAVSWDADGDGYPGEYGDDAPDFLAEVAVGRIPVSDPARIGYTLDKLVAFDQDTGAWKSNALLAGSVLFFDNQDYSGRPFVDGSSCLDSIGTALMSGWSVTCLTERIGLVSSSFPGAALNEGAFNTTWRVGQYAVVNWSGHGWSDRAARTIWSWDDGDGVPESSNGEMQTLTFIGAGSSSLDDDHPSIVFAISCNVGYPEPNAWGNLGVDLLTSPGWGSSAGMVSSSRPAAVSGDWRTNPVGTEQICWEFNRHMIALGERVGDALYDGKFDATTNHGMQHFYEFMNLYNFNLYGDPALAVNRAVATEVAEAWSPAGGRTLRVEAARPNPFLTTSGVPFALSAPASVRIAVYDVLGREIAVLADRRYDAGRHAAQWDGTDATGGVPAPGLYFLVVEANGERAARKVVRLR